MITFRRHYLDLILAAFPFSGEVLDVGGKRENKRGTFRPPLNKVQAWKYLNLDPDTKPDYLCSAEAIPVEAFSFQITLLTEVLEHVERPDLVLAECFRVLKPGGKILATMPFLFPVHGDPNDFQRWAPARLEREFSSAGFREIEIRPMGGLVGVCCDLFETYCHLRFSQHGRLPLGIRILRKVLRGPLAGFLLRMDSGLFFQDKITTGYSVTASRPG